MMEAGTFFVALYALVGVNYHRVLFPVKGTVHSRIATSAISFVCHKGHGNDISFLHAVHDEEFSPLQVAVDH